MNKLTLKDNTSHTVLLNSYLVDPATFSCSCTACLFGLWKKTPIFFELVLFNVVNIKILRLYFQPKTYFIRGTYDS